MDKEYIGSDEHWIDSVNQRYDERERHLREQIQEPEDNRVQCWKTHLECSNYQHYEKNKSCHGCKIISSLVADIETAADDSSRELSQLKSTFIANFSGGQKHLPKLLDGSEKTALEMFLKIIEHYIADESEEVCEHEHMQRIGESLFQCPQCGEIKEF